MNNPSATSSIAPALPDVVVAPVEVVRPARTEARAILAVLLASQSRRRFCTPLRLARSTEVVQ